MKMNNRTFGFVCGLAFSACAIACTSVPTVSSPSSAVAVDRQEVETTKEQPLKPVSKEDESKTVLPINPSVASTKESPDKSPDLEPLTQRWVELLAGDLDTLIEELDRADRATLERLVGQPPSPGQRAAQLRLAMIRMHSGEQAELPESVPAGLAGVLERTRRLQTQLGQSRPRRVGLLLPKDRPWGEVLEKAFRFGLGSSTVEIVVASSENPEAGMRELILDYGVSLVVCGPFLKRAHRAAVVAQRFRVPLISLAREPGLSELGDSVFQVGLTNEAQIDRLVAGAMEMRGYTRFAVLFPRTASGWKALKRFTDQVELRGGQVSIKQPYPRGETTFTPLISSMVGRDATALNINPKYRKCVSEIDENLKGLRRKRKVEFCRDHTPPKIDFDAIFIPDSVSAVRQIMPFVELADMVPNLNERMLWKTRKATDNKELIATPILGMRQLNSHYFASRSRTDVEGTLFVDAYYPYDKQRALPGMFTRAFRKANNRPPDLLETLAYDLGLLINYLDERELVSSRMLAQRALSELKDFEAVTGPWSMNKTGQVERPLYLLSIHKRRILTESDRVQALEQKKKKQRRRGR